MQLDIITPEKKVYSDDIDALTVTTTTGQLTILPGHINLVTQITPGEAIVKQKSQEHFLALTGGFLEVTNNTITILADYAVRSQEIDYEKAVAAQKRAEELLKKAQENQSQQDIALAQSELRRSLLELHVSERRRHRDRRIPTPQT